MTPGRDASLVEPPVDLVAAVTARAADEGRSWFPDLGPGPVGLRFAGGAARARCFLYRFELTDGKRSHQVMVKVRHSRPDLRRENRFSDRPILAPVRTISDEDSARLEHEGLRLIAEALLGEDSGRFGVLRPLAELPGHAAIVTDFVAQPTLRARLLRTSRLRAGRRETLDGTPWENAGAWLRIFSGQVTSLELAPVGQTPDEVGLLLQDFAAFLTDRIGSRPWLEDVAASGVGLASETLPADLPLATAHGDFTATNIFTTADGRVTVFDPLPLWRIPAYQDLATLIVGARVHPLQAATLGRALPKAALDDYEAAVVRGYFGTDPVPHGPLAVFQLLVLLDRWAALVSQRTARGRVRTGVQEARVRLASRHYEAEARRLMDAVVAGSAPRSASGA